jgi:di/tripeptidase
MTAKICPKYGAKYLSDYFKNYPIQSTNLTDGTTLLGADDKAGANRYSNGIPNQQSRN